MARYIVNWKLEGSYTVTTDDLELPEDASIDEVKEVIEDDPFLDVSPITDGKDTIEVVPA